MFKKALVAAALLSAASMNAAHAADGTITFTGTIIAQTCQINGAAPANIPVDFGKFTSSEFGDAGSTLANEAITMELTACPNTVDAVTVLFGGTADTSNNALLAVTGGATGLGIGIYEADGSTPIAINTASKPIPLANGEGTAKFIAKYVATASTVTVGDANATAQYTIQYK